MSEKTITEFEQVPKPLWAFVVKQLGRRDAIYAAFYRAQLEGWIARGWSWGKISEKADAAGWGDWLRRQSPGGGGHTAAKPTAKSRATRKPASKRHRLSADEVERLGAAVVADLAKHPGSKVGEIAQRLGAEKSVVVRVLKNLLAAKAIRAKGDKAKRVYGPVEAKAPVKKPQAPAKPDEPAEE